MSINEYGVRLDKNGYAPSIFPTGFCYECLRTDAGLIRHEVFHGPFRNKSKKYGLWVNLCPYCHNRVHNSDGQLDLKLKRHGEYQAIKYYGWEKEEFIWRFGKNYL